MTQVTDRFGRLITVTPRADSMGTSPGSAGTVDYHVVGAGVGWAQDFTVSFPSSTDQAIAVASIEAASMPSALAPAPVAPVPQSVSRYQAMAIMSVTPSKVTAGGTLLADATAAVNAAGGWALLAWANVNTFDRNGVFINELSRSLRLGEADLDALFIDAARIVG